jgi:hypothetical protein
MSWTGVIWMETEPVKFNWKSYLCLYFIQFETASYCRESSSLISGVRWWRSAVSDSGSCTAATGHGCKVQDVPTVRI